MIVSLNGVIQAPTTAYTVSGATLTFASNLATGDVIDFILLLGNVLDIGTPSDDTVATAKIQDDAVTLAKMAAGTDGNIISYDASGNPVAGFENTASIPASIDSIDETMRWKDKSDISELLGRTVRIKFSLFDAEIFAFWFVK